MEMMRVDKVQSRLWAKRMHTSVKCYKENMQALFMFEKRLARLESANQKRPIESEGNMPINQSLLTQSSDVRIRSDNEGNDDLPDLDNPILSQGGLPFSSTQRTNKPTESEAQLVPEENDIDSNFINALKKIKGLLKCLYNIYV